MSLSKNMNPSLVLIQPWKTRLFITNRLLMGCKESNQANKSKCKEFILISSQQLNKIFTVKPVLSGNSKRTPKMVFNTNCRLMQFKSIAECSKRSILQYFRPSLSYHLSLTILFCLFISGRFRLILPSHKSIMSVRYR